MKYECGNLFEIYKGSRLFVVNSLRICVVCRVQSDVHEFLIIKFICVLTNLIFCASVIFSDL
jgi:hypothetical protein